MKQNHYKLSDEDFANQFATLALNPKWFTHEAHLRLGWIYVSKYGLEKASEMLCEQIEAFDNHFGNGMVYNKTVTIVFAYLIAIRQEMHKYASFSPFLENYKDLLTNYRAIISDYYSFDIFKNERAKIFFVEPNLKSFF